MVRTIQVRVITNEGQAVADDAVAVKAPGELGYLGMLYNHAPLVTTLQPGRFTWRCPGGETRTLLVGTGLLEIAQNRLTLHTGSVSEPAQPAAGL